MMRVSRWVAVLGCGAVLVGAGPAWAGADGPSGGRAPKGAAAPTGSPLIDHGGRVLTSSSTYAIWWGVPADFPSDAKTGIAALLGGFGRSSYLAIATQYMRGGAPTSSYAGSIVDTSAPPAHAPSVSTLATEVAKLVGTPDPNGIYFVYTSNMPKLNYCAWHSAGTAAGVTFQVAYMPNTAGVAGCDPGDLYHANTLSEGTRSLADSTAHEFMEATTDPVPLTGWADKNGQEIGDKCNFVYSGPVTLSNKTSWQLQEEWSNADNGCQQQVQSTSR